MTRERGETQLEAELEEQRVAAFADAMTAIFPNSNIPQSEIDSSEFAAMEVSQRRKDALATVTAWVRREIECLDQEAHRDQPWDVLYASASDREGKVWHTANSEEEAREWADEKSDGAIFGYLKVEQRSLLDEPSDGSA